MTKPLPLILAIFTLASLTTNAHAQPDAKKHEDRATAAFEAQDYATARDALQQALTIKPNHPMLLYNLACAHAQLDEPAEAQDRLLQAISFGFVDFFHLARDNHLIPIKNSKNYQTIILGWRDLLDARADANLESAKRTFGKRYRYEKDPSLRLIYASAFDETSFAEARAEIARVAAWAFADLFTDLHPDTEKDTRPDPWVTVLLPTPEDFVRMVAASNIGGFYSHDHRRLISQDIGPSFRHEFLHVLHWRDMTHRGQQHPEWIMEGLGALVEDIEYDQTNTLQPVPSWRTNITKRLERQHRLTPWNRLMRMDRRTFVSHRPSAHYAEARAVMMFLHDQGKLSDWHNAYTRTYAEDPTGITAIEEVFNKPLKEVERDHHAWLSNLPMAAEEIRPGMPSLGVTVSPGRGDGPRIQKVERRSTARRAGLRMGDVIVSLDNQHTRTMEDLVRILAAHAVGDHVDIIVRRGTRRITTNIELEAAP